MPDASLLQPFWGALVTTVPALASSPILQNLAVVAVFHLACAVFVLADLGYLGGWVKRYLLRRSEPSVADMAKCLWRSVWTNALVLGPVAVLSYWWSIPAPLLAPSLLRFCMDVCLQVLVHDFLFYGLHRALHHKSVFRHIHMDHHQFTQPHALTTFCQHPLDILAATVVAILPAIILQPHPMSVLAFNFLHAIQGCLGHSGYDDKREALSAGLVAGSAFHHNHHFFVRYNYAVWSTLPDRLFGTYRPHSEGCSPSPTQQPDE